jgi:nitroreductase
VVAVTAVSDHDRDVDEPNVAVSDGQGVALSRRSVLRQVGLSAVTVVVAGAGLASYRVYDNGVLDSGSGESYDPWSQWRDDPGPAGTVAAAILAANPHNSQSWTFLVAPTRVDVFADPTRRTGTLDPLLREQHIGLGCALENLVLAAAARGYDPQVSLMPTISDTTHVATVDLAAGARRASPLHDAIGDRHSNRGPYLSSAVPDELVSALTAQTTGLDGVEVRWFRTDADKAELGDLLVEATEAIIADPQQSNDSFEWFRNNRDDIDHHMDGLTLDGQGLDPLTLTLAKILPATSRSAGDQFWLTQTRSVHTRTAAAYGIVTVADTDDPIQRLNGGRLTERIHLAAGSNGLAMQYMNQITERIDRERTTDATMTFDRRLDALLAQPGRRPLVTFRIGYPARAARRSPRRPLAEVTR